MGSVSGYRGLVGPSKPGSELASRHVRSIASGLGNTTYNNCTFLLYSLRAAKRLRPHLFLLKNIWQKYFFGNIFGEFFLENIFGSNILLKKIRENMFLKNIF